MSETNTTSPETPRLADTMRWPEEWQCMAVEFVHAVDMLKLHGEGASNAGLSLAREHLQDQLDQIRVHRDAQGGPWHRRDDSLTVAAVDEQLYLYLTSYIDQLLRVPEYERMSGRE